MLIGNGRLYTNDPQQPWFDNGAVLVRADEVFDLGTTADMRARYPEEEFYDVKGKLIMPGLINCHTHIYSAFARGMKVSGPCRNFLEILEHQWWRLDKLLTLRDTQLSTYQTSIESIRNGVTTLFDHHSSPYHLRGSLAAQAEVVHEVGLRYDMCYESSDRDGETIFNDSVKENIEFLKAINAKKDPFIHAHFGLHASFTLSNESMYKICEAMAGVNAGYHVHTAEGIADEYDCTRKYDRRVIERLFDFGMLGPETMCIHCCHINDREMDILAETKTWSVHNPESNMGNAVGRTPILRMLEKGIVVGLGTDAYTNDMTESVKVAKVLPAHDLHDPTKGFTAALTLLLENNPKIASYYFPKEIGYLRKGAYADLVVSEYKNYTPMNGENFGGHLIFGMYGRQVQDTMVGGRWLMRNREILSCDEEKIFAESRERAPQLWAQM